MGNDASRSAQSGESIENDISVRFERCTPAGAGPLSCREGHVACAVDKVMYVFGGVVQTEGGQSYESNDILSFNTENLKWQKLEVKGQIPSPRSMSTMTSCGEKLYLFGGLSHEAGWFDTMHVFDTRSSTWTALDTSGTPPAPRDKAASVVIGRKIYLFGGFGPKSAEEELGVSTEEEEDEEWEDEGLAEEQEGAEFGWFNDLYIFDTETNAWSNPMQMNLGVPTARAAHTMVAVGQNLVIFGGRDMESRRSDIHIFDTDNSKNGDRCPVVFSDIIVKNYLPNDASIFSAETRSIDLALNVISEITRKWKTDLKPAGRHPEPRSFHAAAAVDARVVVIGGRGLVNQHFADCHIFDTETIEWLQPAVSGDLPSGRSMHTATLVADQVVVFGGSSNFDEETNQCQEFHSDVYVIKTADIKNGKSIPKQIDGGCQFNGTANGSHSVEECQINGTAK